MEITPVGNLLFNMSGGLLPENLTKEEVLLLESELGEDWFYLIGYNDLDYKKPAFMSNVERVQQIKSIAKQMDIQEPFEDLLKQLKISYV